MIDYALLVMLGFCVAGLLALLIAPTIWNRAVRLTTKRLDATLPLSLSDIEADKDLLRASYAIQIRRLEAGLNRARDKSASQLVEISKLQMAIGEMRDRTITLEKQLEERRNAANVFERTINKRFPEMEATMGAAKAALDERAFEIADLSNKMRRKEEALSLLQRSSELQQGEIRKLRDAFEGSSADRTGRFKKRPAQWSLEEYRSEYDRLSLELSKMREQIALSNEREAGQVAILRGELQNLAEQIMTSVAAQEKKAVAQRLADNPAASGNSADTGLRPRRRTSGERPLSAPQPWPGGAEKLAEAARLQPASGRSELSPQMPAPPSKPDASGRRDAEALPSRGAEVRRPIISDEAGAGSAKPETSALKTLLDRATAVMQKDRPGQAGSATIVMTPIRPQTAATAATAEVKEAKADPATSASQPREANTRADATVADQQQAVAPGAPEPNIDRMLREIFEGRNGGEAGASAAPPLPTAEGAATAKAESPKAAASTASEKTPKDQQDQESAGDKKPSLADRLRVV